MAQHHIKPRAEGYFPALFDAVDLVIFDFDGVVADSEVISLATLRETLFEFGLDLPPDEVRHAFLGTSLLTIEAFVAANASKGQAEGFGDRWQAKLFDRFRNELRHVPGITAVLDVLAAQGLRFCIASSGTLERIGIALQAIQMTERFAHVFSAEQVANGKPAPDLFLHAAAEMGVAAERCLVIEDSPFGVRAAKAAGMRCVGFIGGAHLQTVAADHGETLLENGAELLIKSFDDLLAGRLGDR